LNKIADDNGGNRAFGYPGYKASVDFILERVQTQCGSKFDTYVQNFTTEFEHTNEIRVTGPNGEDVFVLSMLYSPATPLPDGVTAALIDTPVNDERGKTNDSCTNIIARRG
jgi:aminopeptidase Y